MSTLSSIINKPYGKSSQNRMSYVQARYAVAYELGQLEELEQNDGCANPLMEKLNSNCRLLMKMMNPDGILPANPFPDTEAFLQSLDPNNYYVPDSKCQFEANIKECLRVICDYQTQRSQNSSRPSVPGVSSPGRANDYINLFLEETKLWFKSVLVSDKLDLDDLRKRDAFYANVRNDKFDWCFPMKNGETEECNVQSVILFLHNEIQFMLTSNNMAISPIKKPAGANATPAQLSRYTPASVRRISPNLSLIKSQSMRSKSGSAGNAVEMTPSKRLFPDPPANGSGRKDLESQSLLERSGATRDFGDFRRLQASDARLSLPDSVSTSSFTSQMDEEDEEERNNIWNTVQWWLLKGLHYLQIIGITLVLYALVVGVIYLTNSGLYHTVVRQQSAYFFSGLFWLGFIVSVVIADLVFQKLCGGTISRGVSWYLNRPDYQAV